ncbi:MAG TPA: (2Fe-2S)-binding protein [Xanthomonadaceae bacterium]|nr:(2Fe-2S)-binding protein [Xanthomonadaceae bacterium]
MYVCCCHAVTEREVRQAAAEGVRTLTELTFRTGCAGSCGSCAGHAEKVLHEARASTPLPFLSAVEA